MELKFLLNVQVTVLNSCDDGGITWLKTSQAFDVIRKILRGQ